MAISTLPKPTSGVTSLQDLYEMLAGKTETSSGGTTTTTTDSGISGDSMNAMFSHILEGTSGIPGLAAVSSGQRSAGGYGSAVNTMLTNDLMSRTAGQVAMQNKHSVTSTVTPETTKTTGGVTGAGALKAGGIVGGLALANNLMPALSGMFSKESNGQSTIGNVVSGMRDFFGGSSSPTQNLIPASTEQMGPPISAMQPELDTTPYDYSQPVEVDTTPYDYSRPVEADPIKLEEFADGGMIGGSAADMVDSYADGGEVEKPLKKSQGVLSTQSNSYIDPRTGLMGKFAPGINEAGVAQGSGTSSQTVSATANVLPATLPTNTQLAPESSSSQAGGQADPTVMGEARDASVNAGGMSSASGVSGISGISRGNISSISNIIGGLGKITQNSDLSQLGAIGKIASSDAIANAGDIASRAMSGDTTRGDVGSVSGLAQAIGSLTRNSDLGNLGTIGKIASSGDLSTDAGRITVAKNAAETIGNIASKGVYGKLKSVYNTFADGPTTQTVVDAVANLNPVAGVINGISSFLGGPSIGTVASNTAKIADPNQFAQGGDIFSANANSDGMARAAEKIAAETGTDPLEALIGPAGIVTNDLTPADMNAPEAVDSDPLGTFINNLPNTTPEAPVAPPDTTPVAPPVVTPLPPPVAPPEAPSEFGWGYNTNSTSSINVPTISDTTNYGYGSTDPSGFGTMGGTTTSTTTTGGGDENADGGIQQGVGDGSGIDDKMHIKVSAGEYVLPADVVEAIGIDKLDALKAKYHVPAAVQKLQSFARK
jgi:hypothetical protein